MRLHIQMRSCKNEMGYLPTKQASKRKETECCNSVNFTRKSEGKRKGKKRKELENKVWVSPFAQDRKFSRLALYAQSVYQSIPPPSPPIPVLNIPHLLPCAVFLFQTSILSSVTSSALNSSPSSSNSSLILSSACPHLSLLLPHISLSDKDMDSIK